MKQERKKVSFDLADDEVLVAETGADSLGDAAATGGRLRITDRRIVYKPGFFNFHRRPLEIPFDEIEEIRKVRAMWITPLGILIRTKSGNEYRFAVFERSRFIGIIRSQLAKQPPCSGPSTLNGGNPSSS